MGVRSGPIATAVLPETIAAATRVTSGRSDGASGATIPTTPVGSGVEKSKYGAATGFTLPRTRRDLVGPAREVDEPVDGTRRPRASRRRPTRPSTCGSRRRTRPSAARASRRRGRGSGPGCRRSGRTSRANAPRAAFTASRTSLREPSGTCARNSVPGRPTSRVRAARLGAHERAADQELVRLADIEARHGPILARLTCRSGSSPCGRCSRRRP